MKKTITTLTLILGLALTGMAQQGGGLFQRGEVTESVRNGYGNDISPMLPTAHNLNGDQNATESPLGGGLALLLSLGGAYFVAKRRKK